ncbi:four helix bundle protein [Candidatus Wolfebacteria bacterium]|nr:MAG: four helix bundle protein [Candidatus Wolfebacteria bacterium]
MRKFRFRQFPVYQDGLIFQKEIKRLTRDSFPKEERFCLTSQIWRAVDSIILNIAEGSDRNTDKDFAHFLNIAHSSLNEVVACLDLALNSNYITEETHTKHLTQAENVANQITAFRKKLLDSYSK